MNKSIIRAIVGIAIGAFFLYLTLDKKPMDEIFNSLAQAKIGWVLMSALALIVAFYLRAIRWKVLLENQNEKASTYNVLYSLTMMYFFNAFTPKLGEILRCTTLNKSEKIPTSVSLGTVVSERIYDVAILVSGVFAFLFFEREHLGGVSTSIKQSLALMMQNNTYATVAIVVVLALVIFIAYRLSKTNKIAARVSKFFKELGQSMKRGFKIKNYGKFIFQTILIWITLVFLHYSFLMSLPETDHHSFYFATIVLFIGGIGWALPAPAGIGTTNFMILQLFIAFNLDENVAATFGLLAAGITFMVSILFGFFAIGFDQLRTRYLRKREESLVLNPQRVSIGNKK